MGYVEREIRLPPLAIVSFADDRGVFDRIEKNRQRSGY